MKKTALIFLVMLLIMLLVPLAAMADIYYATVVNTGSSYLAINQGPVSSSNGGKQIGRIPPGGTIKVDSSMNQGKWFYVIYDGVRGYAYSDYIKLNTRVGGRPDNATVVNTNGKHLAIREGAGSDKTQIGRIPAGGKLYVDTNIKIGSWYYVTYDGVSGFAYSDYIRLNNLASSNSATSAFGDGQYAMWIFPDCLNITCTPARHSGGTNYPYRKPFDVVGSTSKIDTAYAPCDVKIVRIANATENDGNTVWFESVAPVHLANGSYDYITFSLSHDNNIDNLIECYRNGRVIRQGEAIYEEGTKGQATGAHIHVEVAVGQYSTSGVSSIFSFVRDASHAKNINEVFYLYSGTREVNNQGFYFRAR